jgi:hypothetical protein
MALFKTKIVMTLVTFINVNGGIVPVRFYKGVLQTFDEDIIKGLREDMRNGDLWHEHEVKANEKNITDNYVKIEDTQDEIPPVMYEHIHFKTLVEAKKWLVEERNAPISNVDTTKKAIEWASNNNISLTIGNK